MLVLPSVRRTARTLFVLPAVVVLAASSGAAASPAADLDQEPGSTRIISKRADGSLGTEVSGDPSISGSGRYVAFYSEDTRLLGDHTPCCQIYLRDRATGTTELASANEAGEPAANHGAAGPSLSHDGRTLAFWSSAKNLVDSPTRGHRNIYLRDTRTGDVTLITKGRNGRPANGDSAGPSISADGKRVTYFSDASNLARRDTNAITDIFVYDVESQTTTLISRGSDGESAHGQSLTPAISADGTRVAYFSSAGDIVPGDANGSDDVFVYDIARRTTVLASRTPEGEPGNNGSLNPTLSGDGSLVTFWSFASDLAPRDTNDAGDVFVRDLAAEKTVLVSRNAEGQSGSDESDDPVLSSDGTIVTYQSMANDLVPGDTNKSVDVFVYDLSDGSTTLISRDRSGGSTDGPSLAPSPSADGSLIAFESVAGDLVPGDTNDQVDTFVHRRR